MPNRPCQCDCLAREWTALYLQGTQSSASKAQFQEEWGPSFPLVRPPLCICCIYLGSYLFASLFGFLRQPKTHFL